MAVVRGPADSALEQIVRKAFTTGHERTFEQDPGLALRALADIALRALSSAINDPTTAVQAIDRIDSLLRVLVARDLDIGRLEGATGELRLVLTLPAWEDYLGVSVDEVVVFGLQSPLVRRRLERLLIDIGELAPAERRPAVMIRLEQLQRLSKEYDQPAIVQAGVDTVDSARSSGLDVVGGEA